MVSQQARMKLAKFDAGWLSDRHPYRARIRARTGCSVIAVERAGEVIIDIPPTFALTEGDAIYLCGTADAFERFHTVFAESQTMKARASAGN